MNIILNQDERIRVKSSSESIFVDISRQTDEKGIDVEFYKMHFHQIRSKDRCFCMYSVKKIEDFDVLDYGFFTDAEIIWKSY